MATKNVKKPAKAAKPAAKKAPAKKTEAKKVAVKKVEAKVAPKKAAAKPAAKKSSVKSAAQKLGSKVPAKKVVKKPEMDLEAKKALMARKAITFVTKKPSIKLAQPKVQIEHENNSQDLAYSFADEMKRRHRQQDEADASSSLSIRLSRRPTTRTRGENTLKFSDADLDEFRKRLILLRQEVLGQSATLKTVALETSADRSGDDEDGSDAFMRLQNLSQVDDKNKTIRKIDEALARIEQGTYGICEVCGQLIRKPRLLNMPFVHTCIECQSAMEYKR